MIARVVDNKIMPSVLFDISYLTLARMFLCSLFSFFTYFSPMASSCSMLRCSGALIIESVLEFWFLRAS